MKNNLKGKGRHNSRSLKFWRLGVHVKINKGFNHETYLQMASYIINKKYDVQR